MFGPWSCGGRLLHCFSIFAHHLADVNFHSFVSLIMAQQSLKIQVVTPVPVWVENEINVDVGPTNESKLSFCFSWISWQENYEICIGFLQDGGQYQTVEFNLKFEYWFNR